MCQPLEEVGEICRRHDVLSYVDVTASIGGNAFEMDGWGLDVATAGLQKCLAGPSGSAPISLSPAAVERIRSRHSVEAGIRADDDDALAVEQRIRSNYFDLGMILDYWGPQRLNHHTEATSMLYAARECARIVLGEGLAARYARHAAAGAAMTAGLRAMGLTVFGDDRYRMTNVTGVYIPEGVDGEAVRAAMRELFEIEIGTAFGPLQGKVWRLGAMGYNAMKHKVLLTLAALEACLRMEGFGLPLGAAVPAAIEAWDRAIRA
jgi:(S)-ureidoglycine-glyoxylate aminotransferase